MLTIVGLFRTILRPFFYILLFSALIAIVCLFIGVLIGGFGFFPLSSFFIPGHSLVAYLVSFSFVLTLGIPLLALFYYLSRRVRPYHLSSSFRRGIKFIWMTSFFISAYGIVDTILDHRTSNNSSSFSTYEITSDTIYFNMVDPDDYYHGLIQFFDYRYTGNKLFGDDYQVEIKRSKEPNLKIERHVTAQGSNPKVARKYARQLDHEIQFDGKEVIIPSRTWLTNGEKERGQWLHYTIYVPEGIHVEFDNRVSGRRFSIDFGNGVNAPRNFHKYGWKMTKSGLFSEKWSEIRNFHRKEVFDDLETLNIKGNFTVELIKGSENELAIIGHKNEVENVKIIQQDQILTLTSGKEGFYFPVKVIIKTPEIKNFSSSTNKTIRLEGFVQKEMQIIVTEKPEIEAYLEVENLTIIGQNMRELAITGQGNTLALDVNNRTHVKAEDYEVKTLELHNNLYKGQFSVSKIVQVAKHLHSNVKIFGKPEIKIGFDKDSNIQK